MRESYSTNTVWEKKASYTRAVRVGPHIYLAGTTSVDDSGKIIGKNDIAKQFKNCIVRIERALQHFGANLSNVVRTRVYLTDMKNFEDYAIVHGETFAGINPVNTMVEVSALVHPDMLIEVEVDAYLDE